MEKHRFGQFLINKGLVTEADVFAALSIQAARQHQIGQIAIKEGLLTVRQTMQVLREQAGTCYFFGEMAVELGFLTEADVEKLLQLQQSSRPRIGEILAGMGKLDAGRLGALLDEYHALAGKTDGRSRAGSRRKVAGRGAGAAKHSRKSRAAV